MRAGQVRARIVAGPPVMGVRKRGAVRRFMLAMLAPPMMLTTLRMRARQRSA
jgi:hypothetical protein